MQTITKYFRPADLLIDGAYCDYAKIKPIDVAIIATYATLIVPLSFLLAGLLLEYTWRPIPSDTNYTYFAKKILANGGNAEAQYQLGEFLNKKADIASKVKAVEYHKLAAAQNHKFASYDLGYIYLSLLKKENEPLREALGDDVSEKSKYYFNQYILQADEHDKATTLQALAEIAEIEGDYDAALKFHGESYKLYSYNWNESSKKFLAKHHKEKAKDFRSKNEPEKCFQELSKSADFNDLDAKYDVAICYEKGYGVQADLGKTLALLFDLTKRKHEPSIKKLDSYKEEFNKLADAGDARGICNLGYIAEIEASYSYIPSAKAFELYKKAAEMGSSAAQWNLYVIYSSKDLSYKNRVEKDDAAAKMWLKKAANNGFSQAIKALKELEGKND